MSIDSRPIALVTGATRGLGLAIARELGADHHVVVGGRDEATVRRVVESLPAASAFVANLTDQDSLERAFANFSATHDRLDVLVHNAGVAKRLSVASASRSHWQWMMETNVVAVAELTRIALPMLRASRGMVLTINSGAGVRAYPGDAPYCASKWALRAFTECLREEERGRIRVCSIHPGRIDTDMQHQLHVDAGVTYNPAAHMPAEEVARTVRLAVSLPEVMNIDELRVRTTEPKG
ncbi:SDR family oxidoreductase [Schaalia suimastitidis]|uniref:SDR family oxidoreductase n=1 Tax=Schaalia suimastitidis TaxID=121163 RepID=UPI00040059AC|nr:SDR family oxidoreductase [Schaalia suimastitidis]